MSLYLELMKTRLREIQGDIFKYDKGNFLNRVYNFKNININLLRGVISNVTLIIITTYSLNLHSIFGIWTYDQL